MSSTIHNVGQHPAGALTHHAEVDPDETAYGPERFATGPNAGQPPGHSQHAAAPDHGDTPPGGGHEAGANPPGSQQTVPNGNGAGNGSNGLGLGHSQHGIANGPGLPGGQGNGAGNGLGNGLGNQGGASNGATIGNAGSGNGASGLGLGGSHGLGGLVGDTLGNLFGPPTNISPGGGGLEAFGNFAGIVQNTIGFVQNAAGAPLYAIDETVAQRTRPGEPIVDSDPNSSRAPVRSDSPGTTTSTSERPPPDGSETNVFVRSTSSDPSSYATNLVKPAPPHAAPTTAPPDPGVRDVAVREPVVQARAPVTEPIAHAGDMTSGAADAAEATSTPSLAGSAPAQAAGELAVLARLATPLTMISAAPLASEGEAVSEVGRMALFRADSGDGRSAVQDIYGRNYVVYAGDGRNVEKPGNDRAVKAIGTPNIDAIAQDRAANHGELSTHELVWKTVVPALVGVGALFGGASAAGLAFAGSGSAGGPALLAAATAVFGYGALRASLSLRDRAEAGQSTNPLQNAQARRDWIAAGANSIGVLASVALLVA
ncbi:MAG TPA: hypothetical protein VJ696_08505 [Rhodanobacteraceae bacterium]|nr:hypothetical protein [Rhodanobacteraceae bacterium]